MSPLLLEFSNSLIAVSAAALYSLLKPRDLSGHPFFSAQRWTVLQAVLFFFGLDLAYKMASPLLSVSGSQLTELAAWLAFQAVGPLWLVAFFITIRQSVRAAGLVSPRPPAMVYALRWLFGVLLAVALAGMMAPTESVARVFRVDSHRAWWVYFLMLAVAACCAGLIEEVGYRGLLYGVLRTRMSPVVATIASAACFMLAHGEVNPLAFGMGVICARMVERYHSVVPGMILHIGWDLASGINAWSLGSMDLAPHRYFQAIALVMAAASLALWIIRRAMTAQQD
jgi:membrane protease YdiL (CAAX protease family)